MLIPNAKFLVLPLVALMVIAFLPAPGPGEAQVQTRAAVPEKKAGCEQPPRPSRCLVAAKLPAEVLVR